MPPDNTIKHPTYWLPNGNVKGYTLNPGQAFLVDQSGNFLVDQSGNFLLTTPNYVGPLNATVWTEAPGS